MSASTRPNLMTVQDSAVQIALAINKIMGVDVVIVDNNLERITDTFRYEKDRIEVRKSSIIGRIVESGKPLAIDDKTVFRSCIDCPDFSRCSMQSLIGVPIILEGTTVGSIALAISPRHRKELFGNLAHTIGFLEKMAEMLSSKLQATCDYERLNLAKKQREILIDSIDDGAVLVGNEGRIAYYNEAFDNLFLKGNAVLEKPLISVVTHPAIEGFFHNRQPFKNNLVYCESKHGSFDGYITAVPFDIDDSYHGAVFFFRGISNLDAAFQQVGYRQYDMDSITAQSREAKTMKSQAMAAAQHSEAILIQGSLHTRNREIAFAIHNASSRSGGNFLVVNCDKTSPTELEDELFGKANHEAEGKIRLAHKGTLCICKVEYLPQYLQRRLCDYLVRGTVVISGGETVSDARLILSTEKNLELLIEQDLFDDSLYERVRTRCISTVPITGHPEDIATIFTKYVEVFSTKYSAQTIQIEPEALDMICARAWPQDIPQLRCVAEYLVKNARNNSITAEGLPYGTPVESLGERPKAINQFVEEQLRILVANGKSNDEIAEAMQISRATLYRKLKKYNINRKEIGCE